MKFFRNKDELKFLKVRKVFIISVLAVSVFSFAQENSLKFSGNAEIFYTYNFNEPENQIQKNILWRLEARNFSSKDVLFLKDNDFTKQNLSINASVSAWF